MCIQCSAMHFSANIDCRVAPADWGPADPNPFNYDGTLGRSWSAFCVFVDGYEYMPVKRMDSGLNAVHLNQDRPDLLVRLADFLRYEAYWSRTVILKVPKGCDGDALVKEALDSTPLPHLRRPDDQLWGVHSTSLASWKLIQEDGELLSCARLQRAGRSQGGLGLTSFGEPEDYSEYVMLGFGIGPEHVVASQAAGVVITEEHRPYSPGVRLFFDVGRIIEDGLLVRDGVHKMKVFSHLPLDPYLVASVTASDCDPDTTVDTWTPHTFMTAATEHFEKVLSSDEIR
ncbi:MAG: hypothetical protein WCL39_05805 [Armatimonadota bacterium]